MASKQIRRASASRIRAISSNIGPSPHLYHLGQHKGKPFGIDPPTPICINTIPADPSIYPALLSPANTMLSTAATQSPTSAAKTESSTHWYEANPQSSHAAPTASTLNARQKRHARDARLPLPPPRRRESSRTTRFRQAVPSRRSVSARVVQKMVVG